MSDYEKLQCMQHATGIALFSDTMKRLFQQHLQGLFKKAFRTIPEDFLDTAEAQILKSKKKALQ